MKRILLFTALTATLILSSQPRLTGGSTLPVGQSSIAASCPDLALCVDSAKAESVDAILRTNQGQTDGPGAEVIVLQGGKIRFLKGSGFANIERHVPINDQTVFNLASVSKQFTAIAIMKLVEQGKLSLEDTLPSLLPQFNSVTRATQIKVRHLLTHTSGLPDYIEAIGINGERFAPRRPPNNEDVIALLSKASGLCFSPGENWSYSNSAYVVLSRIVEEKTGMRFADYMKQSFFEPLGMNSTFVKDERGQDSPNHAKAYEKTATGFGDVTLSRLDSIYGDGNVHSTICDLAKWLQALLSIYTLGDSGLSRIVVSRNSLKRVFTRVLLHDNPNSPVTYGFGWNVFLTADLKKRADVRDGDFKVDVVTHTGEWSGVRTFIGIIPGRGHGLISILLSNNGGVGNCDEANEADGIAKVYLNNVASIKRFIPCTPRSSLQVSPSGPQDRNCGRLMLSAALRSLSRN